MDGISGIGKQSPLHETTNKYAISPPLREKEDPGDVVLQYVCSKGDIEYHSIKDSFEGVREHEQNHIKEYHEMAQKLGLQVVNPHISVFSEFFPEFGREVAVGGNAKCQFAAEIDGQQVMIPVSKDGHITDASIVKKLENEKKRRMGLLPEKDNKETGKTKKENLKEQKTDNKVSENKDEKAGEKNKEEEIFLFFDGN